MSKHYFRAHPHSAAVIIATFRATVPFRPAGGCATATANAGIEAPCAEDRIA